MSEFSNLNILRSKLIDRLNAKENSIASFQKKLNQEQEEKANCFYSDLVKKYSEEENNTKYFEKQKDHIKKFEQNRDLLEQIHDKRSEDDLKRAEDLIESCRIKLEHEDLKHECRMTRTTKDPNHEDIDAFNEAQIKYKELRDLKERREEEANERFSEHRDLIERLKAEVERQRRDRENLSKTLIQVGILNELESVIGHKETLRTLRDEESSLSREKLEKEKAREEQRTRKLADERLLKEREEQLEHKLAEEAHQSKRDNEYLSLLTSLLGEEEKLESLRQEVRKRKVREHHAAALRVLEERKRRKGTQKDQCDRLLQEYETMDSLRNSILEEEEKRLLLQYVPHLSPLLSSDVLKKLAHL